MTPTRQSLSALVTPCSSSAPATFLFSSSPNVCSSEAVFFFQAEDGIRDIGVTGVQTCALPIFAPRRHAAESMAAELARNLPTPNPLQLSAEQKLIAGEHLAKLLKSRIAYHHSGLRDRKSVV